MIKGDRRSCVVTPYHQEDRATVERCLMSVRRQTVLVDHIVIADGFPQGWLDEFPIRHISLDKAHGDYGNVARGIGALLAISEKYDGIAFLDADNWYDDDHIECCLNAAKAYPESPYVIAQRDYVRRDGSIIPLQQTEDVPAGDHVDTNCYFFRPGSFHLLHYWCTLPQELATHGDRLFRSLLKGHFGATPALTSKRTVKYQCLFESIYRSAGEEPPPDAKPNVTFAPCIDWLNSLPDEDLILAERMSGLNLSEVIRPALKRA